MLFRKTVIHNCLLSNSVDISEYFSYCAKSQLLVLVLLYQYIIAHSLYYKDRSSSELVLGIPVKNCKRCLLSSVLV